MKNELAWNFDVIREQPKRLKELHLTIARQMKCDRSELERAIEYGNSLIEKWKKPPKPRPPRPPRPHVPKILRKHQRSMRTKAEMDAYTGFRD